MKTMQVDTEISADKIGLVPKRSKGPAAWVTLSLVLALTNIATGCLAIYLSMRPEKSSSPSHSSSERSPAPLEAAVFSAQHSLPGAPSTRSIPELSTVRMHRADVSYDGLPSQSFMRAAGVNRILDASGTASHEVHTEIVNGSTFGEFTTADGRV